VSPTGLSFGFVTVGTTARQSFTVTNVGAGPLSGTATSDTDVFAVVAGSPYSLAPGQSTTVTVELRPAAVRGYLGTIVFQDVLRAERPVNGGGVAPPPDLQPVFAVSPSSIELGDVPVGQVQATTLSITDTGQADLQGAARARGVFQTSGSPFGVGAGSSVQVTVFFAPASAQSITDQVFVDINGTRVSVPVHGNGTGSLVTNVPTSFALTSSAGQVTHWQRQTGLTDFLFRSTTSDGLTTIRYYMAGRIADGARFGTVVTEQGSADPVQVYVPDIGAGTTVELDQDAGFVPLGAMSDVR
jgi:hypothetical protein